MGNIFLDSIFCYSNVLLANSLCLNLNTTVKTEQSEWGLTQLKSTLFNNIIIVFPCDRMHFLSRHDSENNIKVILHSFAMDRLAKAKTRLPLYETA